MAESTLTATSFFQVDFLVSGALGLAGKFTKVSGLGISFEYEKYYEGGSLYPRFLYNRSLPQTLVLEQGIVTNMGDLYSWWANSINYGMSIPAAQGMVKLCSPTMEVLRVWPITGAYLTKYIGPDLDANNPKVAVSRIEMIYGGVF